MGAEHGISLSPNVSLMEVLGVDEREMERQYVRPAGHPADGELPEAICEGLSAVLRAHTGSPNACWFCLWSGLGVFFSGAPLYLGGPSREQLETQATKRREEQERLDALPKVGAGRGRDHLLFRGPLSAACSFEPGWGSPCLWWPDDRAWVVATEIDGVCTYVGGIRSAIDDLLASDLETIEVTRDVFMS